MTLSEFNQHCTAVSIPQPNAHRWERLASTRQGRGIIAQPNSPSLTFSPTLEVIVRSMSPSAQSGIESLGYHCDAQMVLDVAERDRMKLFVALHR